jgi:hypothetical protein
MFVVVMLIIIHGFLFLISLVQYLLVEEHNNAFEYLSATTTGPFTGRRLVNCKLLRRSCCAL